MAQRCLPLCREKFLLFFLILEISANTVSEVLIQSGSSSQSGSSQSDGSSQSTRYYNLKGPIFTKAPGTSYASSLLLLHHRKKDSQHKKNKKLYGCANIVLHGAPMTQYATNGIYSEEGMHHDRAYYEKHEIDPGLRRYLYWDDDYQLWCVSSSLGSKVVNLRVADNHMYPNEITHSWESWNGMEGQFVVATADDPILTSCQSVCTCEHGIPEASCIIDGAPKCKSCDAGFYLEDFECLEITASGDSLIVKKVKSTNKVANQTFDFQVKFSNISMMELKKNLPLFKQIIEHRGHYGAHSHVDLGLKRNVKEQKSAFLSVMLKGLTKKQRNSAKSTLVGKDSQTSPFLLNLLTRSSVFENTAMQIVASKSGHPTNPPGKNFDDGEPDDNPEAELPHYQSHHHPFHHRNVGTRAISTPSFFILLVYSILVHMI